MQLRASYVVRTPSFLPASCLPKLPLDQHALAARSPAHCQCNTVCTRSRRAALGAGAAAAAARRLMRSSAELRACRAPPAPPPPCLVVRSAGCSRPSQPLLAPPRPRRDARLVCPRSQRCASGALLRPAEEREGRHSPRIGRASGLPVAGGSNEAPREVSNLEAGRRHAHQPCRRAKTDEKAG